MSGRATTPKSAPGAKKGGVSATKRSDHESQENDQAAKTDAPTGVQPVEPEDAYLTGVSRSLQRRLLGLNVDGPQGQAKPLPEATSAGLHATGSFAKPKTAAPKDQKPAKKK